MSDFWRGCRAWPCNGLGGWVGERVFLGGFSIFSYYTYYYYYYYLVRKYAVSLCKWILYSESKFYKL